MPGRKGGRAMKRVVAILVVGVIVGLVAGISVRGGEKYYKWLPEVFSERYTPRLGEWRAMWLNVLFGGTSYLTDKLIKEALTCGAGPDSMTVEVRTSCQPSWDHYLGKGRWDVPDREVRAAYLEAAGRMLEIVRIYFEEASDSDITISFSVRGEKVAVWHDGQMKLPGE